MVDLHDLRRRAAESEQTPLSRQEIRALLAEVEAARKLLEVNEVDLSLFPMQIELITSLMLCLSQGVASEDEARAVAALITQEVAGLTRMRVRMERQCLC